jgi:hypothetical protein
MAYNIIQGTTIRFYTSLAFTSLAGTAIDPDIVTFGFEIQGQTPISWTYTNGTGDPTGTIVRDGVGLYHADIDTTTYGAGIWIYTWAGKPLPSGGRDTTKTKVRAEGSVTVSPQSVPIG